MAEKTIEERLDELKQKRDHVGDLFGAGGGFVAGVVELGTWLRHRKADKVINFVTI